MQCRRRRLVGCWMVEVQVHCLLPFTRLPNLIFSAHLNLFNPAEYRTHSSQIVQTISQISWNFPNTLEQFQLRSIPHTNTSKVLFFFNPKNVSRRCAIQSLSEYYKMERCSWKKVFPSRVTMCGFSSIYNWFIDSDDLSPNMSLDLPHITNVWIAPGGSFCLNADAISNNLGLELSDIKDVF